jgi:AcrR family transcriptional regulator
VGVDDVMAQAELTRGGFYAHFVSKDELLREAVKQASGETTAVLSRTLDSLPPEERLLAVVDAYLSPEHLAHPECGCPLAAMGPELIRADEETRGVLSRSVRERLAWLRDLLPPGRGALGAEDVVGALACMVGGLVLARALGGRDSRRVLSACRAFVRQSLGGPQRRAGSTPRRRRERVPRAPA